MRILIAEDSAAARVGLEKALLELGHEVVSAADGLQAWERFQESTPEVLISDWMMPGIDGDELCRRVRASGSAYVYFILFTSLEDIGHLKQGLEAGADDYLVKPLHPGELEARLSAATRVCALHQQLTEHEQELERLNGKLYEQARTDLLTGLGNRLRLDEDLDALEGRVERYGHVYAVLMCDVDRFKIYNDARGHGAGDQVLRSLGRLLGDRSRKGDAAYRFGGEEFVVLLPEQDEDHAAIAAERLRAQVEELGIEHPDGGNPVTISIGVAIRRPDTDGGFDEAMRQADESLYAAKEAGRNTVRIAGRG